MIRRNDIFYAIFEIMKTSSKPLTQWQIIKKLEEKGFKKTTCASMFYPCIWQPAVINDGITEAIIKPIDSLNHTQFFELNPKWRKVSEDEARKKLKVRH